MVITVFLAVFLSGFIDAANRKYKDVITKQVLSDIPEFYDKKQETADEIMKLVAKPEIAEKARELSEKLYIASIVVAIAKILVLITLSLISTRFLVKRAVSITSRSSGPRDAAA